MKDRKSRYRQQLDDYENDELRDPFTHSTSYHKFFQGYAERRVPKANGKGTRIERIYVENYYRYAETDTVWRWKKLVYSLCYFMAVAGIIAADTRAIDMNRIPAVGIIQILSYIPLIYLLYKLIIQVSAPRQMTIGERESASMGLQKTALFSGIYLLVITIASLLIKRLTLGNTESLDWAVSGVKLAGTLLILLLCILEKKRNILSVQNKVSMPTEANEIW
jgi:NADH:ubiquinone oxidoreductase subunit 6 (subunit J)